MLTLQDSKRRLATLQQAPENWDGSGSAKPNPLAVTHASLWLEGIYAATIDAGYAWRPPHITADEHGEVVFEWWHAGRKLALYFGVDPDIWFLQVWGPDIENDMADGPMHPEDVAELWRWLNA